ncbi:MAG: gamma subclass chorismate mutase AroQ [Fimbriiglobus sp.]
MTPRRSVLVLVVAAAAGCFRLPHSPPPIAAPATAALLELMNERLKLMRGVAKAKWNTHAKIDDPAREVALLKEMAAAGRPHGLDPAVTTAFFAAQIDAAKLLQTDAFKEWTVGSQGPLLDAPDLKRDVRPKIDALGPQLLAALAASRAERPSPDTIRKLAAARLDAPGVTHPVRSAAVRPLLGAGTAR